MVKQAVKTRSIYASIYCDFVFDAATEDEAYQKLEEKLRAAFPEANDQTIARLMIHYDFRVAKK
ncbi:MAG: hypothetical protein GF308_11615 [Candidatus Heimdallarchaeota archaeon]|nr:hypothetical protein [Candidatus Heimdallarchaeota archaeon]